MRQLWEALVKINKQKMVERDKDRDTRETEGEERKLFAKR